MIKNKDEVLLNLRIRLRDYLEEHGLDTSKNFKCINPKHQDDTPSCNVLKNNPEVFHCFSCTGGTGDIFTACHFLEGKPLTGKEFFLENVMYLAEKYDIEVEATPLSESEIYELDTYRAYRYASEYISSKENTESFLKEIERREWDESICQEWGVGSVADYKKFREYLKDLGFAAGFLDDIDLSREDIFSSNNLIFTIRDEIGRAVGFSARNLLYTSDKKNGPKYNNSRTTGVKCNIYRKGSRLYGVDQLIRNHSKKDLVYIFEGYSDVLTAIHEGITNCVGLAGSSFSREQLYLLKDYGFHNICLLLDADETGQSKTMDILETTLSDQRDVKTMIACLPDGDDPDSFLRREGKRAFKKLKHWTAFEWRLNQFPEDAEPETICEKMIPIIANESLAVKRDKLESVLAKHTNLLVQSIHKDVEQLLNTIEMEKLYERRDILGKLRNVIDRYPDQAEDAIDQAQHSLFELAKAHNEDSFSAERYIYDLQTQKTEEENKDGSFSGFLLGPDLKPMEKALCGEWKKDVWCCWGGGENTGKCQVGDTLILLGNGSYKKLEDVVKDRDNIVISMSSDYCFKKSKIIDWIYSGPKDCYEITLSQYSKIKGSKDHRYFTLNGWKRLEELQVGSKIAVAKDYRVLKNLHSPISKEDTILLAAFLSEGSLTSGAGFSNADDELISLFKNCALARYPDLSFRDDQNGTIYISDPAAGRYNRMYDYLRQYNLFGKNAHNKIIPDDIFKCSLRLIGSFLGMFFACDGWVNPPEHKSGFEIGLSLCNLKMVKQIKSLLLRFGIRVNIRHSFSSYAGSSKKFDRFSITITDIESVRLFYNNIRLPLTRKQNRVKDFLMSNRQGQGSYLNNMPSELWSYIREKCVDRGLSFNEMLKMLRPLKNRRCYDKKKDRFKSSADYSPNIKCNISPDILKSIAYILNDEFLINLSKGDIVFEEISSIEHIGMIDCYDLTVEHNHNYIANDIVSHNSAYLLKTSTSIVNIPENNAMAIYHTIDDTKEQLIPRCVCLLEGSRRLTINKVRDPNWWIQSGREGKELLDIRDKGYDRLITLGKAGRFIMKDANDGCSLSYIDRLIRYYKDKYPDRNLVYILDNFHKLQDFDGVKTNDERVRFKVMSNRMKAMATKHHICILSSVEYPKLQQGQIPTNNNIAETKKIAYDANLLCHIYNDLHEKGDKAEHYHTALDGENFPVKMPRLMINYGKNKISPYKGRQWYDFFPEQSDFRYVEDSVMEEVEKKDEERKDRFDRVLEDGLLEGNT